MRRRILILFGDEWLAYSPTVINLLQRLRVDHDVTVAAIDTGKYRRFEDPGVDYIRVNLHVARVLEVLRLYRLYKALLLRSRIARHRPDEVIAVDSPAAWAADTRGYRFHYLSLEIKQDGFLKRLRHSQIASVVVQSPERYRYLFGSAPLPTYFVQNAPVFRGPPSEARDENALVFLGNAIPRHGIFQCVEFLRQAPRWTLTVKGNIPTLVRQRLTHEFADLVDSGRLLLDDEYLAEDDIPAFLARFYAGFCLYDLALIDAEDFNYISSPSGKLFNYYAAGVPVVASDLLGLSSVKELRTGVAIGTLTAASIAAALDSIAARHGEYAANCLRAAEHFDFARSVEPFVRQLGANPSGRPV